MIWQQRVKLFEAAFGYAASDDWQKTEALKARVEAFRTQHPHQGLSMELLDSIIDWKLRTQRGRTEAHRESMTEALWGHVTECAFGVHHEDPNILAAVQVGMLDALPGFGIGLATAILALTFPDVHGVIDFRVWKVVFSEEKRSFTVRDYLRYLRELRPFAQEARWPVQKADFMVWSYYDEL